MSNQEVNNNTIDSSEVSDKSFESLKTSEFIVEALDKCKNAPTEKLEKVCSSLNFVLKEEFEKMWGNPDNIFSQLKNPVWNIKTIV